jgi:hypothetical protein
VWREVIAALPPHWVDPAGQLILRRLVTQAAIAERLEVRFANSGRRIRTAAKRPVLSLSSTISRLIHPIHEVAALRREGDPFRW